MDGLPFATLNVINLVTVWTIPHARAVVVRVALHSATLHCRPHADTSAIPSVMSVEICAAHMIYNYVLSL